MGSTSGPARRRHDREKDDREKGVSAVGEPSEAPDPDSVRDVCRARAVLEGAGVRRWPVAGEERRAHVRACLDAYVAAVHAGAADEQLTERHLAFHVSLVALTGSPRLVGMAGQLAVEVRLALDRVDPTRRHAHDHADSHLQLLRLLENGDHDGASHHLARHLAAAESALLDALDLA
jgi:DNA-binding GntR family transcriptional regulator